MTVNHENSGGCDVESVIQSLVPEGFKVRTAYSIADDWIICRIDGPNALLVHLRPIEGILALLSPDEFSAHIKSEVDLAVEALSRSGTENESGIS